MRRAQQIQPQSLPCADASENGWLKQKRKEKKVNVDIDKGK